MDSLIVHLHNIVWLIPFRRKSALDNKHLLILHSTAHRQSGKFLIFTCMHGISHFDDCTRIIQSSSFSCCTILCCVVFYRFYAYCVCVCMGILLLLSLLFSLFLKNIFVFIVLRVSRYYCNLFSICNSKNFSSSILNSWFLVVFYVLSIPLSSSVDYISVFFCFCLFGDTRGIST